MTTTLESFTLRLEALTNGGLQTIHRAELESTGRQAVARAQDLLSQRLRMRTHRLQDSIRAEVKDGRGRAVELRLRAGGRGVPYAAAQEFGGEIRPRKGRFLAIPQREGLPKNIRGQKLRFIAIHGGRMGLLVKDYKGRGKAGKGARAELRYILVPRVRLRGVHYLRDGMTQARQGLELRLAQRIVARLTAAGGDRGV